MFLAPLNPLSISQAFPDISLAYFETLDSTQSHLKAYQAADDFSKAHLVVAETQTAGYGQFGRIWDSPSRENIYFSLGYPLYLPLSACSGLSLALALSVVESLALNPRLHQAALGVKWPNDLVITSTAGLKKWGGILIELENRPLGHQEALIAFIGLGINVNQPQNSKQYPQRTSLSIISNGEWDRTQLLISILQSVFQGLKCFQAKGFHGFFKKWHLWDALKNKPYSRQQAQQEITGIARGITETGLLRLECADGHFRFLC